jgi:dolichol-phosphate mannosyltransferase|tara:strand:+ start:295 stop:999 length:705 start_codon:yes stop_codon:yes gene_type:complete
LIKTSIIIPVYKEFHNIEKLYLKIRKYLKGNVYEVIFVDDSSNDGTEELLKKIKKKYKNFSFIIRKKNRDLTQSCFDGIKKAKYDYIQIMDGDLQHNPKYIPDLIDTLVKNNSDLVVGGRNLINGQNPGLGQIRKISSILIIFTFYLFGKKTIDPMSGFFLFKKKIYLENKKYFFGKGYKILADILFNSKSKIKVTDYIIIFDRRFKDISKMNFKTLLNLAKLYLNILKNKISL